MASHQQPLSPQTTLKDYNQFLVRALEAHSNERKLLISKFDELCAAQSPLGDLRAELRDRTQELHETQRLLNEQRLVVQEERETAARLIAENHSLQARVDDDRQKVTALLNMRKLEMQSEAQGGHMGFFDHQQRQYPVMVTMPSGTVLGSAQYVATPMPQGSSGTVNVPPPPHTSLSLRSFVTSPPQHHQSPTAMTQQRLNQTARATSRLQQQQQSLSSPPQPFASTRHPQGVVSSILADAAGLVDSDPSIPKGGGLPSSPSSSSSLVVALSQEVETLKKLLDDQRRAYERDRASRVADERAREQRFSSDLKKHSTTIDQMQEQLNEAVKQLCADRHKAQSVERHLRGEIEILVARAAEAERLLSLERARHTTDLKSLVESQTTRAEQVIETLRLRAKEKDERHAVEVKKHQFEVTAVQKDNASLSEALAREKRLRKRAEAKASAEADGHRSEINLIRQQLRILEKRLFFMSAQQQQQPYHPNPPAKGGNRKKKDDNLTHAAGHWGEEEGTDAAEGDVANGRDVYVDVEYFPGGDPPEDESDEFTGELRTKKT